MSFERFTNVFNRRSSGHGQGGPQPDGRNARWLMESSHPQSTTTSQYQRYQHTGHNMPRGNTEGCLSASHRPMTSSQYPHSSHEPAGHNVHGRNSERYSFSSQTTLSGGTTKTKTQETQTDTSREQSTQTVKKDDHLPSERKALSGGTAKTRTQGTQTDTSNDQSMESWRKDDQLPSKRKGVSRGTTERTREEANPKSRSDHPVKRKMDDLLLHLKHLEANDSPETLEFVEVLTKQVKLHMKMTASQNLFSGTAASDLEATSEKTEGGKQECKVETNTSPNLPGKMSLDSCSTSQSKFSRTPSLNMESQTASSNPDPDLYTDMTPKKTEEVKKEECKGETTSTSLPWSTSLGSSSSSQSKSSGTSSESTVLQTGKLNAVTDTEATPKNTKQGKKQEGNVEAKPPTSIPKSLPAQPSRSAPPQSSSTPSVIIVFPLQVLVAGQAFGSDQQFLNQVEKHLERSEIYLQKEPFSPSSPELLLLFCPVVSRAGTDISNALEKISAQVKVILIVMNHVPNETKTVYIDSRSQFQCSFVIHSVDCRFSERSGLYSSGMNNEAVASVARKIQQEAPLPRVKH